MASRVFVVLHTRGFVDPIVFAKEEDAESYVKRHGDGYIFSRIIVENDVTYLEDTNNG